METVNKVFQNISRNPLLLDADENGNGTFDARKLNAFRKAAENWQKSFQPHMAARSDLSGYCTLEIAPLYQQKGKVSRKVILDNITEDLRFSSWEENFPKKWNGTPSASNSQAGFPQATPEPPAENQKTPPEKPDSRSDIAIIDFELDSDNIPDNITDDEKDAEPEKNQKQLTLSYAVKRIQEIHDQLPDATIGVLVRTNRLVGQIIAALKHRGIEASEEGGTLLTDTASVEAILSVLTLAEQPGDTVCAYHLANIPALADWLNLTPQNYQDTFVRRRLSLQLRQILLTHGLSDFVFDLTRRLLPCCNKREAERLNQLCELACVHSARGISPHQFVELVRQTKAESPNAAKIRVMSIHKSKGLEFDIVILPELDQNLKMMRTRFVTHRETPLSLIDMVLRDANKNEQTVLPDKIRQMYNQFWTTQFQEALCVLYVALTRAVRQLVIIVSPSAKHRYESLTPGNILLAGLAAPDFTDQLMKMSEPRPFTAFSNGNPAWWKNDPAFSETPDKLHSVGTTDDKQAPSGFDGIFTKAGADGTAIAGNRAAAKSGSEPSAPFIGTTIRLTSFPQKEHETVLPDGNSTPLLKNPSLSLSLKYSEIRNANKSRRFSPSQHDKPHFWIPERKFLWGNMIHSCLEQVQWLDREGIPDASRLESALRKYLLSPSALKNFLDEFRTLCQVPAVKELMSLGTYQSPGETPVHRRSGTLQPEWTVLTERPFSRLDATGTLQRGIIDRLVLLREKGVVIGADIIDYKTEKIRKDDAPWNPEEKALKYIPQLRDYADIVAQWYSLPTDQISCRIAFVSDGVIVPVSPDDFPKS